VRSKRLDRGIHEFLGKFAFQIKDIKQNFPVVLHVYNVEQGDYPFWDKHLTAGAHFSFHLLQ